MVNKPIYTWNGCQPYWMTQKAFWMACQSIRWKVKKLKWLAILS